MHLSILFISSKWFSVVKSKAFKIVIKFLNKYFIVRGFLLVQLLFCSRFIFGHKISKQSEKTRMVELVCCKRTQLVTQVSMVIPYVLTIFLVSFSFFSFPVQQLHAIFDICFYYSCLSFGPQCNLVARVIFKKQTSFSPSSYSEKIRWDRGWSLVVV